MPMNRHVWHQSSTAGESKTQSKSTAQTCTKNRECCQHLEGPNVSQSLQAGWAMCRKSSMTPSLAHPTACSSACLLTVGLAMAHGCMHQHV
jgi:hypothetical protein